MSKRSRASRLPSHVQGMLNQEKRVLKQTLDHLERESCNKIRTISQEHQVLSNNLKLLEQRLAASQKQSRAVLHPDAVESDRTQPNKRFGLLGSLPKKSIERKRAV